MIVETKYGALQSVDGGTTELFWGVPYAAPPVGDLRFAPPQPPIPWEGIRLCDTPGNMCMQERPEPVSDRGGVTMPNPYYKEFYSQEQYQIPMSEDCLYLNIRVPKGGGEKLPVAFWIHGGAFMGGTGYEMEFDGNALSDHGIILVTINYRCNIFGFFSHPELTAKYGTSGNCGILDQITALTWVYENIAAFGGDPDNITLFGQSAGCMSVQTLISSPMTRGMVRRAILQSGCGYGNDISRNRTQAMAEEEGTELLDAFGLTLEQLMSMPAEEVRDLGGRFIGIHCEKTGTFGLLFTPVQDGKVLTDDYDAIVDKGLTHDIDYLLGSTENDLTCTPEQIEAGEPSPLYNSCIAWALKQEELGRSANYVYFFRRRLPGDDWGAFHSSELWYMFGTLGACWRPLTEGDFELSRRMVGYWANFIKNGDPNGAGLPRWEACTLANNHVQLFDV